MAAGTLKSDRLPGTVRLRESQRSVEPQAFTLVELLVVLATLGLLLALLMPALQVSREAARRAACMQHLRQMGIGLQACHAAEGAFPPGGVEHRAMLAPDGRPYGSRGRQLAWSAYLLPYLEEYQLFSQLDLSLPFDALANAAAASTRVAIYLCPSVPDSIRVSSPRAPSDYGGIYGERVTGPNQPPRGVMLYDRRIRAREITDGLSRTLIVAEDGGSKDGEWINGLNLFDQAFAINAAPAFENDIRSQHPGGALVLFCDGAVQFLADDTPLDGLAAMCTRAGREVLAGSVDP